MEKTADEIQKDRIKEIEEKASALLNKCSVVTLASINEKGYPRICAMTSKRSHLNGKATHFENNKKASVCYKHAHI